MVTQVGSFILVYVECKVAIPMVSTRKTDDDHHVADSEAIGRLRHELIKSTGNRVGSIPLRNWIFLLIPSPIPELNWNWLYPVQAELELPSFELELESELPSWN